jgi:hypothetical protein|tara:strand:+ start:6425 stop:6856 length:432 start_codon:yes stop_codon:yes gene_type:complete
MKKPNKKPKKYTPEELKKYTPEELKQWKKKNKACDHYKLGYSALNKLALGMFARSKQDAENIRKLSDILYLQKKTIEDLKKVNVVMVDKYEDKFEEYEKANDELKEANTQLTLNVDELKTRLFGSFEMRLKNLALRPDKKKDN